MAKNTELISAAPRKAAKVQKDANALVQSFTPVTDFVGYPYGKAHPIHFRAGVPSTPVPVAWINSLSEKKTDE